MRKCWKKRGDRRAGRALAAVMAVLLTCSLGLTACGASAGAVGMGKNGGEEGGSASDKGAKETLPSPKGRFLEEEIELPEEIRENGLVDVLRREDGSLEFAIPTEEEKAWRYVYDGSQWIKGEEISIPEGVKLRGMFKGEDGAVYYTGFDDSYCFHLWTEGEGGERTELFPEIFAIPEGAKYGIIPDFLGVPRTGGVLISSASEAAFYDSQGTKKQVLPQDYIGMDTRIPAAVEGNSYYTISGQAVVRYDLASGQRTGSFSMPAEHSGGYYSWTFFEDGESVYGAGPAGLYRTALDGSVWEQLIDGSLNSMSRQDLYLRSFCPGKEGDYYGIYTGDSRLHLFRYYFDETVEAVPPLTLTVYALRDHPTVRQAAVIFQKENPQVRVDFRIAVEDPDEEVTEDVIRALNTELVNGKGADVLILDGLPAETYRKKGILADMSGALSDLQTALLPNLVKSCQEKEGEIYCFPARILVPVIFGSEEGRRAMTSLTAMEEYAGEKTLFAPDIYENILYFTGYTCYGDIFEPSGELKEGALERWLSAVKKAGEKSTLKTSFTESEMTAYNVNNYVLPDGFGRQGAFNLAVGECAAAAELLGSIESAIMPFAAADRTGSQLLGLGGLFLPRVTAGINAASENRSEAEAFIRTLFGEEVQNESLSDGFAVRVDSLQSWAEKESEISMAMGNSYYDIRLGGSWPARERREDIMELVRAASVPAVLDTQIMEMVVDGSRDYLDGKEDLEQAVQRIENKIQLYLSERG